MERDRVKGSQPEQLYWKPFTRAGTRIDLILNFDFGRVSAD